MIISICMYDVLDHRLEVTLINFWTYVLNNFCRFDESPEMFVNVHTSSGSLSCNRREKISR